MKFNRIIGRITRSVIAGALALTVFLTSSMSTQAAVLGIDVSKFQGGINWGAVPSSGVSYVFIKAGSVKSGVDPCFAANLAGAQAAGLRTGAYIYSYATSVQGAVNEANLMLQWIAPYTITFPVVYDIEDKLQKNIDANTITAMCNAFCDVMYGAGYYPMIYHQFLSYHL